MKINNNEKRSHLEDLKTENKTNIFDGVGVLEHD